MLSKHILAHRGCWGRSEEKNTDRALLKAFHLGFGLETDLRDWNGEIVISHDPPTSNERGEDLLSFDWLARSYAEMRCKGVLALNVKADGLAHRIHQTCRVYGITDYFVFDMSVPDSLQYMSSELPVFVRDSEYESPERFANRRYAGVWCDNFTGEHNQLFAISTAIKANKIPAVVSPELHGRQHFDFWAQLKSKFASELETIYLCTDFPEQAKKFYGDCK